MNTTHTFYHIPGVKVGCTDNFERRKKQYPPGTDIVVMDTYDGLTHQEAGDFEWFLADIYGYPRGWHYGRIRTGIETLGPDGLSARAIKTAETLGTDGCTARSNKGVENMGPEGLSSRGKKVAETLGSDGCSARVQKQQDNLGAMGRSARAKKAIATQGPEAVSRRLEKAWVTRRRNALM